MAEILEQQVKLFINTIPVLGGQSPIPDSGDALIAEAGKTRSGSLVVTFDRKFAANLKALKSGDTIPISGEIGSCPQIFLPARK